jgi:hypothetical protein
MDTKTATPPTITSAHRDRCLPLLEAGTLLVLAVLVLWSVRALLEEWGLFHAFNAQGLGFIRTFAASIPLRPLHLVPTALYWELLQGRPGGVAVGTLLLLVLRYGVARWAVAPLLQAHERWIVATLAAVLIGWPGAWLGRFAPAQFSALFFFAAFGFAVRLHRGWSWGAAAGCIASILVLLGTYQALALCLVALPLFALLWSRPDAPGSRVGLLGARRREIRVALTIVAAFVLYGIYALLVSRGASGGGYEANLAESSGRLLTLPGLSAHIGRAYLTVYGAAPSMLPLLLLMAFYLGAGPARLTAALVVALPLFALIYLNDGHIRDPDRVMYPVSVAFVVATASLLSRHGSVRPAPADRARAAVVVGACLLAGLVAAYHVKQYANVQRQIITQALTAIDAQHPRSLLIQDATGALGDVYTLLNPTLSDALAVHGRPVDAVICTLSAVDRFHPDARRYPISTTPRCEEVPAQTAPVLRLVAREEDGKITLRP